MAYRLGVLVVIAGCLSATLALPPWERTKREEPPLCLCPANIDRVCGSDGKTYSNKCILDCAASTNPDITLEKSGSCDSEQITTEEPLCICTEELIPVCGSDGITYSNKCLLDCATTTNPDITLEKSGSCDSEQIKTEEPLCICTEELNPVCGSDGITYSNKCLLDCETTTNPDIILEKLGECDLERTKREEPQLCLCPANIDPVCGTDQKTYPNNCVLDCEKERSNVEVAHKGPCRNKREEPICACTFELNPTCGTDGQTYPNKCSLECEKQRSNVNIEHEGPCRVKREEISVAGGPVCLCTEESRPVCGNNGLTYANPCLLNCAKDYSKSLDISHEGECEAKPVNIGETGPRDFLCNCPKDRELVCASNGLTYANECLMKCDKEDLSIAHGGPCDN